MTPLALMLIAYQQKYDVEGNALAKKIGIAEATLTRIKQGRMPDAAGLAKIVNWMVGN